MVVLNQMPTNQNVTCFFKLMVVYLQTITDLQDSSAPFKYLSDVLKHAPHNENQTVRVKVGIENKYLLVCLSLG